MPLTDKHIWTGIDLVTWAVFTDFAEAQAHGTVEDALTGEPDFEDCYLTKLNKPLDSRLGSFQSVQWVEGEPPLDKEARYVIMYKYKNSPHRKMFIVDVVDGRLSGLLEDITITHYLKGLEVPE